jgi:hypothetical protein
MYGRADGMPSFQLTVAVRVDEAHFASDILPLVKHCALILSHPDRNVLSFSFMVTRYADAFACPRYVIPISIQQL